MEGDQRPVAVVQRYRLVLAADVRRVHLVVDEEDVGLPRWDRPEVEAELPVLAGLAGGRRLHGVDRQVVDPASSEDELGLVELLPRGDVEASLVEKPAAHSRRRRHRELRRGGRTDRGFRALPEDVEQREHRHDADEPEQAAPDPDVVLSRPEVAITAQDDGVWDPGHAPVVNEDDRS